MKILVIGQCSLQKGRMEFGNIGNYYIAEPFFRELHSNFKNLEIKTTLQFSKKFCSKEKVKCLPLNTYYNWRSDELKIAKKDLGIAKLIKKGIKPNSIPRYIKEVIWSDLVIDFSGDIWGDNADFLGKDRFEVGLIRNEITQILLKKTALLAGSPGPFNQKNKISLAKKIYKNFSLVTNREEISTSILKKHGFDLKYTKTLACPAFLFEPKNINTINNKEISKIRNYKKNNKLIGFILCGWNFTNGPFDLSPRNDCDYDLFVDAIEKICIDKNVKVILLSHSNGFNIKENKYILKNGRDYVIAKQLFKILKQRNPLINIDIVRKPYLPNKMKAIIGMFDILISGRIHGAVAGLSQNIPTVMIDYGHEPKAHKLIGFAKVVGMQNFIADPSDENDLNKKIDFCMKNIVSIKSKLKKQIPLVKKLAKQNFTILKEL